LAVGRKARAWLFHPRLNGEWLGGGGCRTGRSGAGPERAFEKDPPAQ
jgi:hypothetical protein